MTSASIVLAAALTAWGPIAPAPDAETPGPIDEPAAASSGAGAAAPEGAVVPAAAPAAPAPGATTVETPIIAKAPVNVSVAPALVATPERPRAGGGELHKQWWFWTVAGGCFALVIVATIIATRPGTQPYTGNAAPYYVPFP